MLCSDSLLLQAHSIVTSHPLQHQSVLLSLCNLCQNDSVHLSSIAFMKITENHKMIPLDNLLLLANQATTAVLYGCDTVCVSSISFSQDRVILTHAAKQSIPCVIFSHGLAMHTSQGSGLPEVLPRSCEQPITAKKAEAVPSSKQSLPAWVLRCASSKMYCHDINNSSG